MASRSHHSSGTRPPLIIVWDYRTGGFIREFACAGEMANGNQLLHASPDGRRLAIVCHSVEIWDALDGQYLTTLDSKPLDRRHKTTASWSPDGSTFAFIHSDGMMYVWRAKTRNPGSRPPPLIIPRTGKTVKKCGGMLRDLKFSSDERWLLSTTYGPVEIYLWDLNFNILRTCPKENPTRLYLQSTMAVAFDDTSTTVVIVYTAGGGITIARWDLERSEFLSPVSLVGYYGTLQMLTWDRTILTMGGRRVYWEGFQDGTQLMYVSDTETRALLWSRCIDGFYDRPNRRMSFSHNGEYVAMSSKRCAMCLWRVRDGKRVVMNTHLDKGPAINRFSEDSQWLAMGAQDRTVSILRICDYDR